MNTKWTNVLGTEEPGHQDFIDILNENEKALDKAEVGCLPFMDAIKIGANDLEKFQKRFEAAKSCGRVMKRNCENPYIIISFFRNPE